MEENIAKKRNGKTTEEILEIVIAVLLGVVTLLTAWASWIGSLHGGNQATNYTTSNNMAADGNARYNQAAQTMMQDMILWSEIGDLQTEIQFAQAYEDEVTLEMDCYKLYYKCMEQLSESMATALLWDFDSYAAMEPTDAVLDWMSNSEALTSPFSSQEYVDAYFADAYAVLAESETLLQQGEQDNTNGDRMGLVTVFYSVVLFLLGIVNTFKGMSNKYIVIGVSVVCLIAATIIMCTVPLPTGFSLSNFFH